MEEGITERKWSEEEKKFVLNTLNDPRGWSQFFVNGLEFKEIGRRSMFKPKITMDIQPNQVSERFGPHIAGLNFTVISHDPAVPSQISFHEGHWDSPPAVVPKPVFEVCGFKPNQRLEAYRAYVINHEVGHALGIHEHIPHGKCSTGRKAAIMTQQTKGTANCFLNPWPTEADHDLIDFDSLYRWLSHGKIRRKRGNLLAGGELLGQGKKGCAFRSRLFGCDFSHTNEFEITKVIDARTRDAVEEEMRGYRLFIQVDPDEIFHATGSAAKKGSKVCIINKIPKEELESTDMYGRECELAAEAAVSSKRKYTEEDEVPLKRPLFGIGIKFAGEFSFKDAIDMTFGKRRKGILSRGGGSDEEMIEAVDMVDELLGSEFIGGGGGGRRSSTFSPQDLFLAYAHMIFGLGKMMGRVVHRDLHLENVMLSRSNENFSKMIDFGFTYSYKEYRDEMYAFFGSMNQWRWWYMPYEVTLLDNCADKDVMKETGLSPFSFHDFFEETSAWKRSGVHIVEKGFSSRYPSISMFIEDMRLAGTPWRPLFSNWKRHTEEIRKWLKEQTDADEKKSFELLTDLMLLKIDEFVLSADFMRAALHFPFPFERRRKRTPSIMEEISNLVRLCIHPNVLFRPFPTQLHGRIVEIFEEEGYDFGGRMRILKSGSERRLSLNGKEKKGFGTFKEPIIPSSVSKSDAFDIAEAAIDFCRGHDAFSLYALDQLR